MSPQSTFKMKVVCFCQFTGTTSQVMGVDTDINQSFKVSLQTEVGEMEQLSQSHDENQWHRIVLHSKTGYLIRTRRACPSFEARGIFLEPDRRNIYICISSFPRGQCIFCVCIKGQSLPRGDKEFVPVINIWRLYRNVYGQYRSLLTII